MVVVGLTLNPTRARAGAGGPALRRRLRRFAIREGEDPPLVAHAEPRKWPTSRREVAREQPARQLLGLCTSTSAMMTISHQSSTVSGEARCRPPPHHRCPWRAGRYGILFQIICQLYVNAPVCIVFASLILPESSLAIRCGLSGLRLARGVCWRRLVSRGALMHMHMV